jgi:hypothetical protein
MLSQRKTTQLAERKSLKKSHNTNMNDLRTQKCDAWKKYLIGSIHTVMMTNEDRRLDPAAISLHFEFGSTNEHNNSA